MQQAQRGFFIQFLHLAGPFWKSENKAVIRQQTLILISLTIVQMVLAVTITEWSAALFNAIEQHSMAELWVQIGYLILIFVASLAVTAYHLKIKRQLQIAWRAWLTERVTGQWMHEGQHYLVTHIQTAEHDNPDGRISEDIRIATDEAITLSHSLFYSVLLLISFTEILWTLSGTIELDLGLFTLPISGYLVVVAIIYSSVASLLGWWVGQPLTIATNAMQTAEANFRFSLVKAREHSQAIALIHGEEVEKNRFHDFFQNIIKAYNHQTTAWSNILVFNSGYSVLSTAFPVLIAAPRYILGNITLGALMQSVQAFQQVSTALSWPANNMAAIAQWRASVERVLSLVKALEDLDAEITKPDPQRILVEKPEQNVLVFDNLCLSKLNGEVVLSNLNASITQGEHVLIKGDTANGSKLFKAIAGLWPWGSGRIELPDGDPLFFMSPRPFLPEGTLRTAICYPCLPGYCRIADLEEFFKLVGLEEFIPQLDQVDEWDAALTRAQQQRLGVVRLLLYAPKWILIEEAFDSLDPETETDMLRLICQQLPDATLLTMSNQPTAEVFHNRHIVV